MIETRFSSADKPQSISMYLREAGSPLRRLSGSHSGIGVDLLDFYSGAYEILCESKVGQRPGATKRAHALGLTLEMPGIRSSRSVLLHSST